ncbi:MAG: aminoglycoside 6-adenylyltransferase [Anaerolineales bacterium]
MGTSLDTYRSRRDNFLDEVITSLSKDDWFVAAWLTGSISRGEDDSLSDIDISVVVSEEHSPTLCTRLEQVSASTSSERFSFFSRFGNPALIHENNNNAPEGGTFTFVMYFDSAIMVDWILIPQSKATRPHDSKLLFDKASIPVASRPEPESLEQRKHSVTEQWAFFWMMSAITIKYILRNDSVFTTQWIEHLHSIVRDIERKLNGEPWQYHRGSLSQLSSTRENQIQSLRQLCQRMQELQPKVTEFTGSNPSMPITEIETLFSFAQSSIKNRKS